MEKNKCKKLNRANIIYQLDHLTITRLRWAMISTLPRTKNGSKMHTSHTIGVRMQLSAGNILAPNVIAKKKDYGALEKMLAAEREEP